MHSSCGDVSPTRTTFPWLTRRSFSSSATRTDSAPRSWTCARRCSANTGSSSRPRSCRSKTGRAGYRMLFSHNVQFPLSQAPEGDRTSMATLAQVFPALASLKAADTERVELVNSAIVEEVLQDLGTLDFGKGITAASNIAIWRERGTHHTLCGEYRLPGQVQAPGRPAPKSDRALPPVFRRAPTTRERLALARHDQDRARLPPQRQCRPRAMSEPVGP